MEDMEDMEEMEEQERRRRRQQERERLADEAFFDGLLLGHYLWQDAAVGTHPHLAPDADEPTSWDDIDDDDLWGGADVDEMDAWD